MPFVTFSVAIFSAFEYPPAAGRKAFSLTVPDFKIDTVLLPTPEKLTSPVLELSSAIV